MNRRSRRERLVLRERRRFQSRNGLHLWPSSYAHLITLGGAEEWTEFLRSASTPTRVMRTFYDGAGNPYVMPVDIDPDYWAAMDRLHGFVEVGDEFEEPAA